MLSQKIIAVDFDNTLFKTNWIGNVSFILHPIWPVIHKVKEAMDNGAKVILWTCRTGKDLDDAVDVCEKVGLHFDAINENLPEAIEEFGGDSRKIFAHEYWDDLSWNPILNTCIPTIWKDDDSIWLMKGNEDVQKNKEV